VIRRQAMIEYIRRSVASRRRCGDEMRTMPTALAEAIVMKEVEIIDQAPSISRVAEPHERSLGHLSN
jgi:hypothetical protein